MATWETSVTKSDMKISDSMLGRIEARGARGGDGMSDVTSEYDVVGINVSKIPDIKSTIEDYISALSEHLDGINNLTDAKGAFRSHDGAVEAAVNNYINKVKEYSKNLISDLGAFNTKLQSVSDAWQTSTTSLAGTIDETAIEAGTTYTSI